MILPEGCRLSEEEALKDLGASFKGPAGVLPISGGLAGAGKKKGQGVRALGPLQDKEVRKRNADITTEKEREQGGGINDPHSPRRVKTMARGKVRSLRPPGNGRDGRKRNGRKRTKAPY